MSEGGGSEAGFSRAHAARSATEAARTAHSRCHTMLLMTVAVAVVVVTARGGAASGA